MRIRESEVCVGRDACARLIPRVRLIARGIAHRLDSNSFATVLGRHRHAVAVAEDWRDVVSPIRRAATALSLRMVQQQP